MKFDYQEFIGDKSKVIGEFKINDLKITRKYIDGKEKFMKYYY